LTDSSDEPDIHPSEPRSNRNDYKIGYGKPSRHAQFRKGTTGCPTGRPKRPPGISIKDILDGDQRGKNGEVISRREAYVIALVNDALRGNQKAFSKFMNLMNRSGLIQPEQTQTASVIEVPEVEITMEEFRRNFGRSKG
jgi:Family of unknown function (DUF5681)